MFGLFKKKEKREKLPKLLDLEGNPLTPGDEVMSMRYNLGKCRINATENGVEYESIETGEKVSWVKMIDASTDNQKVKKVITD